MAYVDVVSKEVTQVLDLGAVPGSRGTRQLHRSGADRPAAHHPEAHQHHPARRPQLHRHRRQPRRVGKVEPGRRLRCPRRRGAAQPRLPGRRAEAPHHQPRLHCRDGGSLRRPVPHPVLAELLRHRRIPGGPVRQLARTRLRLPRRHHLPQPGDQRRLRQPPRNPQRHLHARGGLGHPGQAQRPLVRHHLHPPQPPPGDLLLHHHRQLRLRLLLVPLPRRHHRVRGQGHRRRVHQRLPRRRLGQHLPARPGPGRAVPPAPLQRPPGHGHRRLHQPGRGRGRGPAADG